MKTIDSLGQIQFTNDSDLSGPWPHGNMNTIPASIAERCQHNVVDRHVDIRGEDPDTRSVAGRAAADHGRSMYNAAHPPVGSSTMPARTQRDTRSTPNSQTVRTGERPGTNKVTGESERTVKDGNGNVGKYTGKRRMAKNTSTGRLAYVPTGQGRMDYGDETIYDGEWQDGLWHGDGMLSTGSDGETYQGEWIKGKRDGLGQQSDSTGNEYAGAWKDGVRTGDGSFTHHSGWTVEGQWEKDRCIECSSVIGLTNTNYESVYDWAQEQEAAADTPPLLEPIGGLGADLSQFLRDARSKGWTSVVRFLVAKGVGGDKQDKSDQPTLRMAIKEGNLDTVKRLLKDGAAVDVEDEDGFTALDIAILRRKLNIVRELCKTMNISTTRLPGGSPYLHWAVYLGRVNVVRKLINEGDDVDATDNHDWTPLHKAGGQGYLDIVKLLVGNEADVNAKTDRGDTPLHHASRYGHLDVVQFLVDNNGDVNAKNWTGNTPLAFAKQYDKLNIAKYLRSKGGV